MSLIPYRATLESEDGHPVNADWCDYTGCGSAESAARAHGAGELSQDGSKAVVLVEDRATGRQWRFLVRLAVVVTCDVVKELQAGGEA